MSTQNWNRLHIDNLHNLIALRDAISRDIVLACYDYGIDKTTADCYAKASDQDLHKFAFSVDHSLFVPRYIGSDLCTLLKTPAEIRGLYATVNHTTSRHQLPGNERFQGNGNRVAAS